MRRLEPEARAMNARASTKKVVFAALVPQQKKLLVFDARASSKNQN